MLDLRAERLNRGYSLDEMAARVGIGRSAWVRAENGTRPVPANAKLIADYFNVKVTDLWPVDEKAAA